MQLAHGCRGLDPQVKGIGTFSMLCVLMTPPLQWGSRGQWTLGDTFKPQHFTVTICHVYGQPEQLGMRDVAV